MYNAQMAPMYGNLDDQFQAQQLSGFALPDGRAPSPLNGERLDVPQTHEQLLATNASLKTRVSELEVIQELYRGRLQQLEQEETIRKQEENMRQVQEAVKSDDQLHAQVASLTETNAQLQRELDESHRRENMLKRRLDELEVELKEAKEAAEPHENGRAKKPRLDDGTTTSADEASPPKSDP